jgi:hypothetical protein
MAVSRILTAAVLLASPPALIVDLWFNAEDLDVEPTLVTVDHTNLDVVARAFDAASDHPRMMVFFSSACGSCDSGSAALQEMLEEHAEPLFVVAVWEPIAPTDGPPPPSFVDNLRDRRVLQIWDPTHVLSDALRASEDAHPGSIPQARLRTDGVDSGILYDTVAIFGPGPHWAETLPAPDYLEGGLAAILEAVHLQLHSYRR